MKYGFDIDDTLSKTSEVICKYAVKFDKEKLGGTGILQEVNNSIDYYYFADALKWDREDITKFFDFYYIKILKEVKMKNGVSDTLKILKEKGNQIYLITARREKENGIIRKITEDWLKENKITYDELYIDIKEKYNLINNLKIDIFVDDGYKNCIDVIQNCNTKVYMIETEFNKNIKDNRLNKIEKIEEILQ